MSGSKTPSAVFLRRAGVDMRMRGECGYVRSVGGSSGRGEVAVAVDMQIWLGDARAGSVRAGDVYSVACKCSGAWGVQ